MLNSCERIWVWGVGRVPVSVRAAASWRPGPASTPSPVSQCSSTRHDVRRSATRLRSCTRPARALPPRGHANLIQGGRPTAHRVYRPAPAHVHLLARQLPGNVTLARADHDRRESKHADYDETGEAGAHAQTLKVTPSAKFGVLARLSRAPKRSVGGYVSIGAQRKRSENPKSADVAAAKNTGDGPAPDSSMLALVAGPSGRACYATH
jgi:hypothetical protein